MHPQVVREPGAERVSPGGYITVYWASGKTVSAQAWQGLQSAMSRLWLGEGARLRA